ncbi:MAG: acyltransferase family protein [Actinomycetes bacterium]
MTTEVRQLRSAAGADERSVGRRSVDDPIPAGAAKQRFRADVEGLRAIAVLAVVLYHAGVPWFAGGFVGVDVFFVLSGFLITGLLLGEIGRTGRISISNFYARRVRRLLPAATTVLAASAIATVFLIPLLDRAAVGWDIVTAGLFVANWRFAVLGNEYGAFDQGPSPVLNYWSLGVEEQFYLVWPLLLIVFTLLARRWGANPKVVLTLVITAVAGASLWWSVSLTTSNQPLAFFSSPARAWELAAGALIALLGARAARIPAGVRTLVGWVGIALIFWAVFNYNDSTLFPGVAATVPVLGTAAVLVAGAAEGRARVWEARRWLATAPARYIGRVSYSWYLWHWPMLVFAAIVAGSSRLSWSHGLVVVAASFVVAVLTLKLIENPIRQPRNVLTRLRRTRAALLLGLLLIAVSVGAGLWVTSDSTEQASAPVVIAGKTPVMSPAEASKNTGKPPKGCYGPESSRTDCYYGVLGSKTTIALTGDSHSMQWYGAALAMANSRGWRLHMMPMPSCQIADVRLGKPLVDADNSDDCRRFGREVIDRLIREHPAVVMLSARNGYQEAVDADGRTRTPEESKQLIADGTARYVAELRAAGITVVFLRDTPTFAGSVPTCVAEHLANPSDCDVTLDTSSLTDTTAMAQAVQASGAVWVDTLPWVCPTGPTCTAVDDALIKYRDEQHMTYMFSATLADELGRKIKSLLASH